MLFMTYPKLNNIAIYYDCVAVVPVVWIRQYKTPFSMTIPDKYVHSFALYVPYLS